MGFFNKKGDKKTGIPELPELPAFPESAKLFSDKEFEDAEPISSLPSYPNSNFGERINQSAIKDAVTYGEPEIEQQRTKIIQQRQQLPRQKGSIEIEGQIFEPSIISKSGRKTIEISDYEPAPFPAASFSPRMPISGSSGKIKQTGPLFIQLDKFEESIATLDEIKLQVSEIESLLRSIQEIKNREEEKLIHWQRQIESIKAQLDKVDRDLFGSI